MVLIDKRTKNLLVFILKFTVSCGLLYLLAVKVDFEIIIQYLKHLNPLIFIFASGLYIFSIYISSLRWALLINKKMSIKSLFKLYMIGSFFNTCLPGIIGGDAIKAYYLSKELKKDSLFDKGQSTRSADANIIAIASVFMDRYIGFSALIVIGMIAFPFGFPYIDKSSPNQLIMWLMPIIFFSFFSISYLLFRFKFALRVRFLSSIYEYINIYSNRKDVIIKGFIYSVLIQLSGIMAVYILSVGMSFEVQLLPLLIFMPMIIAISLVPISISGIGLREFAFAFFFSSVGIPSDIAVALSLAWFLSVIFANLWGLFEYLRFNVGLKWQNFIH